MKEGKSKEKKSLVVGWVECKVVRRMKNGDAVEPWELEVGPHRFS